MNRVAPFQRPLRGGTSPIVMRRRPFDVRTFVQAIRCALQGLCEAWQTQPNLRFHVGAGAAVIVIGALARLSIAEWLWLSFAIGLVIFAELMNTAIEQTVDLVVGRHPDPLARRVKDVAAGCVLVSALLAVTIGVLTFAPHLRIRPTSHPALRAPNF